MSTSCGRVHIILGGTFDPVHFGHLRMAQEMLNRFPEAHISLMPAAYPPHRQTPGATTDQRIEMLKRALQSAPELVLDTRELERDEPSYSVVTLGNLRLEIGDNPLIFLMGTDAFDKLDSWHRWRELLDLTNILVVGRPSSQLPEQGEVARLYQSRKVSRAEELAHFSSGRIGYCEMPQLDISSTAIREQIKSGFSPRFLLPDVILDYIQQHGLYGYQAHLSKGN